MDDWIPAALSYIVGVLAYTDSKHNWVEYAAAAWSVLWDYD